jgi:uncharacterized protein
MQSQILSEHPVSDAMRATIVQCLLDIESKHHVKVLFACESGSRGWGFASPDSDYDVRFVYVNRLDWYLTVEPGRDVIEQPISGELDVNGWDLRKALKLLHSSNPVLLEWLRSPIVYMQDEALAAELRSLTEQHLSMGRAYHHYVSMAKKNLREHLLGETVRYKKYLYVLRPLLAARWIRDGRGAPPMRFAELAEATLDNAALIDEINRLLEVKMRAGEAATSPRWEGIHAFILSELDTARAHAPSSGERRPTEALDIFLQAAVLRHGVVPPLKGSPAPPASSTRRA